MQQIFNTAEQLALATSIKHREGFPPQEILEQMKRLQPVSEVLVKTAIIDYLGNPSYADNAPMQRPLEKPALSTIKSLLGKPDSIKTSLISSGLDREVAHKREEVAAHIYSAGQDPDYFLTLDQDDVDALLSVNPIGIGDASIQNATSMSEAIAIMWQNNLHNPDQVSNNQDAIVKAYKIIHTKIAERLKIKREIQLAAIRARNEAEIARKKRENTPKPYDARAKFIFSRYDYLNPSLTYQKMINLAQITFMVERVKARNPELAITYLNKLFKQGRLSEVIDQENAIEVLMDLFKNKISLTLASEIGLKTVETSPLLNTRDLGNEVSLLWADTNPPIEEITKLNQFLPPDQKTTQLTTIEVIGLKLFSKALELNKN